MGISTLARPDNHGHLERRTPSFFVFPHRRGTGAGGWFSRSLSFLDGVSRWPICRCDDLVGAYRQTCMLAYTVSKDFF